MPAPPMATPLRFGEFELDLPAYQLRRNGRAVQLERIPMELLICLADRPGQLVSRTEIEQRLWGQGVFVDAEPAINTAIRKVRRALGDDADAPRFIETVVGKGYRFIAPLAMPETAPAAPENAPGTSKRGRSLLWPGVAAVAAIAVVVTGVSLWLARGSAASIRAVAVLPLDNLSGDPGQDYFADGLTEALITNLGKLQALRVTSRTSVAHFRGANPSLGAIAAALGVDAVIEGGVLRSGNRIRITIRMIDVRTGNLRWGESYEREAQDVFRLEGEIALEIARQISLRVPDDRRQSLASAPRISPEAQDAYLLGRQYWNQRTEEGLRTSIDYFRRAIDREPQFALAHAGLADAYTALGYFSFLWPVDAFKTAETEAQHAIDLDPSAGEPHATMGYIRLYWDWDWLKAEEEFRQALTLSPGYANAHEWHSVYLSAMGRLTDAAKELEEAKGLDPLSLAIATDAGWQQYLNRQYAPAVAGLSQTIALNDRFPLAHLWRGRAYEQLGEWDHAIAEFAKTSEELHDTPVALAQLGHAYAASGRRPDAVRILDRLQVLKHSEKTYVTAYGIALIHAGLGDTDAAFDWLATACEERTHWLVWMKLDPRWDGIRADARFARLLQRVHLSE